MKQILALLALMITVNQAVQAQDKNIGDSLAIVKDSASWLQASNFYTPPRPPREHGNFNISINDPRVFTINSGVNVLNTLRGQVPSLGVSAEVGIGSASIRSGYTGFLVDGVPFGSLMVPYLNLNSSEYDRITVLSSNSNIFPGSLSLQGGILLTSRTGEGYSHPAIEFNSYSTMSWNEGQAGPMGSPGKASERWMINNGVAFMQDFGAIDARVSFNYRTNPSNAFGNPESNTPSIRVNTGFNIHPKLNLRMILDKVYTEGSTNPNTSSNTHEQNFDQATFVMNLNPFHWLFLNTQHSFTDISSHNRERSPLAQSTSDNIQEQRFHKAVVTFKPSLGENFGVNGYVGFQQQSLYQKIKAAMRSNTGTSALGQWQEYNIGSTLIGSTFSFRDFLFADVNLRRDNYSALPDDKNPRDVKTAGASFVFSRAFGIESTGFSMGKIRFCAGDADQSNAFYFPFSWNQEDQYLPPSGETQHEFGTDLNFINDRLTISASRFKRVQEGLYLETPLPPWIGGPPVIADLGELHTSGWEIIVGSTSINRRDLKLHTKLIWSKYKTEIKSESDGGGGEDIVIGNPNPDWTGSILNQLTWKRIFVNCVVDIRKGGDNIFYSYTPSGPVLITQDASNTKLRELSFGFQLNPGLLSRWGVDGLDISVAGRNLITFYKKSTEDPENFSGASYLKSVSAGVRLTF
jgi:hypothetical protein